MHIRDQKEHLRLRIKERLADLSPRNRAAESRSICRRMLKDLPDGNLTVAAYAAMPSEADLRFLLDDLLKDETCSIYLPRFTRAFFEYRQIVTLDDLMPGTFNLPEPPFDSPLLDLKSVTHALIPGLAFDRQGHRLGRGNGGFDRWISDLRKVNATAKIWGIALECQLVDTIPLEAHDQTVDAVVTPREMMSC